MAAFCSDATALIAGEEISSPSGRPPIRYIKLGRGGAWAADAIRDGVIPLGYSLVPHDLAAEGDREAVIQFFMSAGRTVGKAASFAREILDFYELGPEAIWITFAQGHLWWAHASREVTPLSAPPGRPQRQRRTLEGWRNTDRLGRPLREGSLSTRLTKVAAFRQTICRVDAEEYLLRKLAGQEEPAVLAAMDARAAMVLATEDMIAGLHWADFETLVDLLLSRGGWHRISALGGTQRDIDLMVEQPVTGETAFVQVKSSASQRTFDDYITRFDERGTSSRLIFVCHSPRGPLDAKGRPEVIVWGRRHLAEAAIKTGLLDWLIDRAA